MREELEKLVIAGKIGRQHLNVLVELTTGGYCVHRSWGFGKITTLDTVFSRLTIDFQGKRGHSMDLGFAAESLKPIPPDHILARKASDLAGLRQMAALNHLDLIKVVLQSYGGKATIDQIQQVLVPDVITEDWKKWWEVAKRELKKDGHFQVPIKKSEPLVFQSEEVSLDDRLLSDLRAAKGLKAKLVVAQELIKNLPDVSDKAALAAEFVSVLNTDIASHQRTLQALALEAVFMRDEIQASVGMEKREDELIEEAIWAQVPRPGVLMENLPAAKYRRAVKSFQESNPEGWSTTLLNSLNSMSTKLCGECVLLLIQEGRLGPLKDQLARLISQHQASSEMLLWLAKERSDTFVDILGPEVFRAMMTAMERDQFNEKRSNKLRDFILDDQKLLVDLIGTAELDVIKDLTRALQLSPCFDDMDKRSLLARIVKNYPAVQSLISGEQSKQDSTLVVSWESLERKRDEYSELVRKRIPANSKEIAVARSYGDLRENHEYKAAKEMQKMLLRQKAEFEVDLVRARGTDFSNPNTDIASIGTTVTVTELSTGQSEILTILGAWDSDPEKGVISYLTPLAQCLLNQKVGDELEFEFEGAKKHYRLESIVGAAIEKSLQQEAQV